MQALKGETASNIEFHVKMSTLQEDDLDTKQFSV